MEGKKGMIIEEPQKDQRHPPLNQAPRTDQNLLMKRDEAIFKQLEGALDISQIKAVLKSPAHFAFIFGFERKISS